MSPIYGIIPNPFPNDLLYQLISKSRWIWFTDSPSIKRKKQKDVLVRHAPIRGKSRILIEAWTEQKKKRQKAVRWWAHPTRHKHTTHSTHSTAGFLGSVSLMTMMKWGVCLLSHHHHWHCHLSTVRPARQNERERHREKGNRQFINSTSKVSPSPSFLRSRGRLRTRDTPYPIPRIVLLYPASAPPVSSFVPRSWWGLVIVITFVPWTLRGRKKSVMMYGYCKFCNCTK